MLRDAISSGKYQVGDRLTESNLAKDVDVSRTPVREALQRLAAEGFVDISPHAGAVVKGWTQTDVREVFETRALIESAAAGLAARNATAKDLAALQSVQDQMEAITRQGQTNVPAYSELNRQFHATILEIAGNRRMADIALNLMDLGFLVRSFTRFAPENVMRSEADHRLLIQSIKQGDERWAEAIMRGHILAAASIFTGTEAVTEKSRGHLHLMPRPIDDKDIK